MNLLDVLAMSEEGLIRDFIFHVHAVCTYIYTDLSNIALALVHPPNCAAFHSSTYVFSLAYWE